MHDDMMTFQQLYYYWILIVLYYISLYYPAIYPIASSVGFARLSQTIREPLSNYPVDTKTISVRVNIEGDSLINTSVCYRTLNGTAKARTNYVPLGGKLNFRPAVGNSLDISVTILADHSVSRNTWFYLALYRCSHDDHVIIAPHHNVTRVVIKNTVVGRAFFPSLPIVTSSHMIQNGSIATVNEILSYDNPIVCLTVSERTCMRNLNNSMFRGNCTQTGLTFELSHKQKP